MCGICGFTQATEDDRQTLQTMCSIMAHRGPDGEGLYVADGIALGHRRLSLIDFEGGNQPMVRATAQHDATITSPAYRADKASCGAEAETMTTGDFVVVYNGEIYNYRELRAELEATGWHFKTNSDTEVLLVSYLAWGEDLLDRLRGMFAFALWDRQDRKLFCARDYFGIKPFYYTLVNGQFIFASEIKSILEHPAYSRELNEEALEHYLCFQFSALPETFFKGIFKLPQGHCLTVQVDDGSMQMRRWWQPSYCINEDRTEQDTVEAIDETIRESVRYHNVADVEVGSFLSSGIDSSYLAACLAQENPHIHTFTVGFSLYSGDRDEVSWARELAERLHITNDFKHISEDEYWESLARVQWHMDEPSADPSAVSLYFVDQLAAQQVKAVLSGEGADEFFGGYRIYQAPLASQKLSWCPRPLLRGAAALFRALHLRGANYLKRASEQVEDWYYTNANDVAFSVEERARLLRHPVTVGTPQELVAPTYAEVANLDETTRMQHVDIAFWLVGDILLKTDKMAMAHSLESRVPFLDRRVFNVAASIPTHQKVHATQTKLTLRQAAERAIPQSWAQKEKLGFPTPIVAWLREEKYYHLVRDWFTGFEAQQFFNTEELCRLLDQHKSGQRDNSRKIWIVYMFLLWYRIYFVDRSIPSKPEMH